VFHTVITKQGSSVYFLSFLRLLHYVLIEADSLVLNQVNGASVEIYWLPNYQELKEALESYGFRISLSHSQDVELAEAGSCPVSPCSLIGGYFFFRFYNTTGVR